MKADTVGVLMALEADLKALTAAGTSLGEPAAVGGRRVHRLQLGPHRVYTALMGSGCVETAVTTEALLARHRCDLVFSVGPAGALRDEAKVGTWWCVSACVLQGRNAGEGSASSPLKLAPIPETWTLPAPFLTAKPTVLISGETFINSPSLKSSASASGATLVDMNVHGLAAACENHDVPLHVWRVVSDAADEQASEVFKTFVKNYDGVGGEALAELIRNLPANPKAARSYPGIRSLLEKSGSAENIVK